jgi:hypothetical protein
MITLQFPAPDFRIKNEAGKEWIFDGIRKQWVRLTPEEWVRQNLLQYLLQVKQYPAALIAVEKEIRVGDLRKRCDILVYRNSAPWLLIECKEMNVPIDESVLRQALIYHSKLQVPYLVISNGSQHAGYSFSEHMATELTAFPDF